MTPTERAQAGKLGAYVSWANTPNRTARTAPGRRAADAKFDQMVIDAHGVLPPEEHAKCAAAFRSAHYAEMALKSVRARKQKRAGKQ